MVSGHVDGTGKVVLVKSEGVGKRFDFEIPSNLSKYVIGKGSIAIDGVSLTVAQIRQNLVSISVIPYTLENTTLGQLRSGDRVNIEVDMIGKYVEKFIQVNARKMDEEWLRSKGFSK
jgi:riboflavin synthase